MNFSLTEIQKRMSRYSCKFLELRERVIPGDCHLNLLSYALLYILGTGTPKSQGSSVPTIWAQRADSSCAYSSGHRPYGPSE